MEQKERLWKQHNRDGIENWGSNYLSIFSYAEKNEVKPDSNCTVKVKQSPDKDWRPKCDMWLYKNSRRKYGIVSLWSW